MAFYAAKNTYATNTNIGFVNTWYVAKFATKAQRDAHVEWATDLATKAISSKEIRKYGGVGLEIDSKGYCSQVYKEPGHAEFKCETGSFMNENGAIINNW